MNYHKECLRQLGKGNLDPMRIAHEYAASHPKEFLQFVAPEMIKRKVISVRVCTDVGSSYPFTGTITMGQDVFEKCLTAAKDGVKSGMQISAIKTIRTLTNSGLREAKCFFDMVKRGEPPKAGKA